MTPPTGGFNLGHLVSVVARLLLCNVIIFPFQVSSGEIQRLSTYPVSPCIFTHAASLVRLSCSKCYCTFCQMVSFGLHPSLEAFQLEVCCKEELSTPRCSRESALLSCEAGLGFLCAAWLILLGVRVSAVFVRLACSGTSCSSQHSSGSLWASWCSEVATD